MQTPPPPLSPEEDRRLRAFFDAHPELADPTGPPRPLAGDVSSRRYFRGRPGAILTLYPQPFLPLPGPALPPARSAAYFKARLNEDADAPLTWANDPLAQIEATETLAEAGIPVPVILAAHGQSGVVAVADLGDDTLERRVQGAPPEVWTRWYGDAVDLIARLQGAGTEVARARGSIPAGLALDGPKLTWEMAYFDAQVLSPRLSEGDRRRAMADLTRLCAWLGARPRALCHRDYHGRNLMISPDPLGPGLPAPPGERLVIIDHQDARMGPRAYDMVSLLQDPYLRPDAGLAAAMWARFHDQTAALGPLAPEEVTATLAQRLIKAAGTYGAQLARGRIAFQAYLGPTLTDAAAALRALGGYGHALAAVAAAAEEVRASG